ncbi:Putative Asparagine synthetase [Aspergillus calidoustus]|uniref:asparagine synthase (glutamine-hydrolyzing) n=1 Tax=Aspergillus calidoustus TaxID=454130 RepID=A0A0U5FQT3_ASPCI|nr:Putative Asparagine synthetase [Aspergillus calidoustus]
MCGLTALLALNGGSECLQCDSNQDPQALERQMDESLELVKHRGPDARGQWFSPDYSVGLGHARFSIIDLSPAGNQPFHDDEDTVHAVVNGELYDYEKYKAELGNEYEFKSNSDCEIVIALYRHYGISFVSKLRGEFALVLWDAKRKLFFAARDRYGIKSLYYTVVNNKLLVATEMKSFLPFGWQPEWDNGNILEKGWLWNDQMYFKGVRRLEPGQYMVSLDYKPPEVKTYWDLDYPDKKTLVPKTEEEIVLKLRELLLESVKLRLRADVEVGIYLSGGLDSSAIAGMTAHLIKQGELLGSDSSGDISKMSCYTIRFGKHTGVDESDIAQRTADWIGVDLHPVTMTEDEIAARFEDTVWYTETPIPDVNGMGRVAVGELAHSHGKKVILTGEGSDEHFGGYPDMLSKMFIEPDLSWPPPPFEVPDDVKIFEAGREAIPLPVNSPASTKRMLNNSSVFARVNSFYNLPFASWATRYAIKDLETAFAERFGAQTISNITEKWHPLHSASYQWIKSILVNYILRYIGDGADMAHQIETRPPFLDHHVTEFANQIPPSLKIRYDPVRKVLREKYILREAMRPFVTDEIMNRTKQAYLGPSQYREDGALYKVVKKLLTKENVKRLGFVDWDQLQDNLVKGFREGDQRAFRISLFVAQLVVLSQRFGVKTATDPLGSDRPEFSHNAGTTAMPRMGSRL